MVSVTKRRRPFEADVNEFIINKRVLSDRLNLLKISDSSTYEESFCDRAYGNHTQQYGSVTDEYTNLPKKYHDGIQSIESLKLSLNDESTNSSSTFVNPFDYLIGAKSKYVRKVDYLIDEVIRKTRRKFGQCNMNTCFVPSNIGPQPTTDHALSVYHTIPIEGSTIKSSSKSVLSQMQTLEDQLIEGTYGNPYPK